MSRQLRNGIAMACYALFFVSFLCTLGLDHFYISSRLAHPNPELGLVNSFNEHGRYVYISNEESTGLTILWVLAGFAFLLTLAIVPKTFVLPPPGTPRWLPRISAHAKLDSPTPRSWAIFFCAAALYLAAILLLGNQIVHALVSHGIQLIF